MPLANIILRACKCGRLSSFKRSVSSINKQVSLVNREVIDKCKDVDLIPFRISSCAFGEKFTSAQLEVTQYMENKEGKVVHPMDKAASVSEMIKGNVFTYSIDFGELFENGFTALQNFIIGETGPSVNRHQIRPAEESLIKFLDNKGFHEECLEVFYSGADNQKKQNHGGSTIREEYSVVLLANHLFSHLALNNGNRKYIVSEHTKSKSPYCPCTKQCGSEILYGNTTFGSEFLWYGQPDIMIFPLGDMGCNVVFPAENNESDTEEDYSVFETENSPWKDRSQINEKKSDTFTIRLPKHVRQIVSQAITFSFYQKRIQEERHIYPKTTLIPTIAASNEAFDIYMYDCDNDILLRNKGGPIPFFLEGTGEFNTSAIIHLWMVINHSAFIPYLLEDELNILQNTCNLHTFLNQKSDTDSDYMQLILETIDFNRSIETKVSLEHDLLFVKSLRQYRSCNSFKEN